MQSAMRTHRTLGGLRGPHQTITTTARLNRTIPVLRHETKAVIECLAGGLLVINETFMVLDIGPYRERVNLRALITDLVR